MLQMQNVWYPLIKQVDKGFDAVDNIFCTNSPTGYTSRICHHTATTLFQRYLLFIGGNPSEGSANQVKLFDSQTDQWQTEESISPEIGEKFFIHRSVDFPRENGGLSVICLGGYKDNASKVHPDHMVVFEITQKG